MYAIYKLLRKNTDIEKYVETKLNENQNKNGPRLIESGASAASDLVGHTVSMSEMMTEAHEKMGGTPPITNRSNTDKSTCSSSQSKISPVSRSPAQPAEERQYETREQPQERRMPMGGPEHRADSAVVEIDSELNPLRANTNAIEPTTKAAVAAKNDTGTKTMCEMSSAFVLDLEMETKKLSSKIDCLIIISMRSTCQGGPELRAKYLATAKAQSTALVSKRPTGQMGGPEDRARSTDTAEESSYLVYKRSGQMGGPELKAVSFLRKRSNRQMGGPELRANSAALAKANAPVNMQSNHGGGAECRGSSAAIGKAESSSAPTVGRGSVPSISPLSSLNTKQASKKRSEGSILNSKDDSNTAQKEERHIQSSSDPSPLPFSCPISVSSKTHYEKLQLDPNSTVGEIKKAYRKMALMYHPDRNKDDNAEHIFKHIQKAYAVLSDDVKRMGYDAEMRLEKLKAD